MEREIKELLDEMKDIQEKLLNFINDEENVKENFYFLNKVFESIKIRDDQHKLRLFLRLLIKITNHHHRCSNFYSKIEMILESFKDNIKKLPNTEIFDLFKSNKRILLFLIEENIMIMNEPIVKQIIKGNYLKAKYPQYFAPVIKVFMSENWFPRYYPIFSEEKDKWVEELNNDLPENFYENRKKGESCDFFCNLIQNDSVEEFISYVTRYCISHNSTIKLSIFETNSFLIKKNLESETGISLIEYSAFYGSIQIFNFLKMQGVKLNSSLWYYIIHSQNAELIHLLEEYHIEPIVKSQNSEVNSYIECFIESIKCHHNSIADYIYDTFLQSSDKNNLKGSIQYLKYYNFNFIQKNDINNKSAFFELYKRDYYSFVKLFLDKDTNIINYKNDDGKTALYLAVEKGNVDIVKLLLSCNKLDINITNNGKTALFLAVEKENAEIVKLLLTHDKIKVNIINKYKHEYNDGFKVDI